MKRRWYLAHSTHSTQYTQYTQYTHMRRKQCNNPTV